MSKAPASLFRDTTSAGIPLAEDPLSDFRKFLYLIWWHLNLPEPTPAQYDMAHTLQRLAYGDPEVTTRMILMAFRGIGKSWVASAFVVWLLYMNPQLNILVVSASKMRADEFTTFTLRLIREVEFLKHLAPDRHQRQSSVAFDVAPAEASHAPSVKSLGINSQLAGSRADIIVPDDIEVGNNSMTQGMRDKLSEAVKEFDAILKPGGRIVYLGTPQSEMSIYNTLATRGYKTFIWPARVPDQKRLESYGAKLAKFIRRMIGARPEGSSTDPQRFSDFDLAERELSYGKSGFALQFMLDTSLSDAEKFPLKCADLIVLDTDLEKAPESLIAGRGSHLRLDELPMVGFSGDGFYRPQETLGTWLPYAGAVMFVDPAGRGKDETGYAVTKALNSRIYLTAAGGLSGGYIEPNLRALAETAKAQRVNVILIESNFGQGMFAELLKPILREIGWPCAVEEVRSSTQKEARIIDTLEPVMNQHRLIVDRKVIEKDFESTRSRPPDEQLPYQLFYQLTRITRDRGALVHDDRLDALAGAVAYWVDRMALDAGQEIAKRKEEELREEVRRVVDGARQGLVRFLEGKPPGGTGGEALWVRKR